MAYTTIDDPTIYFNTVLYTGNGSTQSISSVGFQPDWVWIKDRSATNHNMVTDSVRGATKTLFTNLTNAESTDVNTVTAFNSDGFSIGSDTNNNANTNTYVSWNWKAGGSASSNSNGSITSSVSANTTAGFSIVSYTGTGSNATVGHGLGVAPKMMIFKNRSAAQPWCVYHDGLSSSSYSLHLDETSAEQNLSPNPFNSSAPTSTLINLGGQDMVNKSSDNHIAYCFAEKKGYSKFGSYTGNGNADGTFVYTGFKPAWVLVKRSDASESWFLYDNKRNAYTGNERYYVLRPNITSAENTTYSDNWQMDFLSNGFKLRTTAGHLNSGNLIYMAFAESPFTTSTGIPTTAM